jgi:putative ABC transport system permease protein
MNSSVLAMPLAKLALAFIPCLAVVVILFAWSCNYRNALWAIIRMLAQLLLIGYVLVYIFDADNAWIVLGVVAVMVLASSWIALNAIKAQRSILFSKVLISITVGGGLTLALITQGVLDLSPWYWPRYFVPLAGMIFANAMNSVSLAAERLVSELDRNVDFDEARRTALRASLIPLVNSLFAVGIVALPGMMTGQILSGVSPLVAARYQIMVMCMIFGAGGISSVLFLVWVRGSVLKPAAAGS